MISVCLWLGPPHTTDEVHRVITKILSIANDKICSMVMYCVFLKAALGRVPEDPT